MLAKLIKVSSLYCPHKAEHHYYNKISAIYLAMMAFIFIVLSSLPTNAEISPVKSPFSQNSTANITIFNRTITILRAQMPGVPTEERALPATNALHRILATGGHGVVTYKEIPQGYSILLDAVHAFTMIFEDTDTPSLETLEDTAKKTILSLQLVVRETGEVCNVFFLLGAAGFVLLAGCFPYICNCQVYNKSA